MADACQIYPKDASKDILGNRLACPYDSCLLLAGYMDVQYSSPTIITDIWFVGYPPVPRQLVITLPLQR